MDTPTKASTRWSSLAAVLAPPPGHYRDARTPSGHLVHDPGTTAKVFVVAFPLALASLALSLMVGSAEAAQATFGLACAALAGLILAVNRRARVLADDVRKHGFADLDSYLASVAPDSPATPPSENAD